MTTKQRLMTAKQRLMTAKQRLMTAKQRLMTVIFPDDFIFKPACSLAWGDGGLGGNGRIPTI